MKSSEEKVRKHLWVLALYTLLSLLLTWPMAAHFGTHVPGDGIDDPSLAWNLWWIKHALVDQPQNPFACTWQFWPIGINLAFYTLTVLNGLLGVPLQVVFSVVPAYNLLLLLSFVLSGLGAYLLSLDFLRHRKGPGGQSDPGRVVAAFVGGALYAFASAKMFYASLGQGNIASSQWIPFAALYILRATRGDGKARDALLAGLFMILQAYAEMTFASFLVVFAALCVLRAAYCVLRTKHKIRSTQYSAGNPQSITLRLALLALIFAVGIAPILANMLPDLRTEGDFFTSGGGFADIFSADLAGYMVPTQLHPLLGDLVKGWSNSSTPRPDGRHFAVDKGQHLYLGYIALALAGVGLWHGRRRGGTWFWAASAALFFLLTLGPSLRIAGHDTGIPLPFRVMEQLPFFKGNRYPSRYSAMLLMSLAPLVAAGFYRVVSGRWQMVSGGSTNGGWPTARAIPLLSSFPVVPLFLLLLLLFEHLSVPLPVFDLRVPALYDRVAAEPGHFALLELPLGWRNGARVAGKPDIVIMQQLWYQSRHGKRLLGGNTSRNPEYKFQYFSEDPTLARLIAVINATDLPQHEALRAALAALPVTEADQAAAREWAALLRIRYVMLHRDKLPAGAETLIRDLLPLDLVAEEGNLALYRLSEPLTPAAAFQPGSDQGRRILGEGWSSPPFDADREPRAVYAQRKEVRLLLPLPTTGATVRLSGQALAPEQTVTVIVNGRRIGTQPWPQAPTTLAFTVPADPGRPPLSDVRLRFARVASPADLSALSHEAGVLIRSAGQETGDFAHIYISGRDRSPNRRGYNLVAFDPVGGQVVTAAAFDTHADPAASAVLARWVNSLPDGVAVAGAVRDEAAMNLTEEAVTALRSLGVKGDLRGHFRWGHAFLGRKGAAAGTAIEALDGIRPAQVQMGLALSEPGAAVTLTSIEIVQ